MFEELLRSQLISTTARPTIVIINLYMPFVYVFTKHSLRKEPKHVSIAKLFVRLDKFGTVAIRKMFRNTKIPILESRIAFVPTIVENTFVYSVIRHVYIASPLITDTLALHIQPISPAIAAVLFSAWKVSLSPVPNRIYAWKMMCSPHRSSVCYNRPYHWIK